MLQLMNNQIDDLLSRVQKRVPKLIDQLALAEVRTIIEAMRKRTLQCSECGSTLKLSGLSDKMIIAPCPCTAKLPEERVAKAFRDIAKLSNDPEVLKIIGKAIKR